MFNLSDNSIYLFFAIMAVTEISAQFLFKKGSKHKDHLNLYFCLGLLAIFITYIFFYLVMRSGKHLSVIHATHHTFIIIALSIGSYFLFSQTLNSNQMVGLVAVIIGTIILALNEKDHIH